MRLLDGEPSQRASETIALIRDERVASHFAVKSQCTSCFPSSALLRFSDPAHASRRYSTFADQALDLANVPDRPYAIATPGCEPEQISPIVETPQCTIDPPKAKCLFDCLVESQAARSVLRLVENQHNGGCVSMVFFQPRMPLVAATQL